MTFTTTVHDRWFEDYRPGDVHVFGPIAVSEDEIIEFAERFDPQPIHVDPIKAKDTIFGGLIASGWHTGSLMMRLYGDHYLSHVAGLASPGLDELRWPKPVRPGDALSIRLTVIEAAISRSKPDRGVVRTRIEVINQHDEVVMSMIAVNLFLRRPTG